jgi:hypothetical protein
MCIQNKNKWDDYVVDDCSSDENSTVSTDSVFVLRASPDKVYDSNLSGCSVHSNDSIRNRPRNFANVEHTAVPLPLVVKKPNFFGSTLPNAERSTSTFPSGETELTTSHKVLHPRPVKVGSPNSPPRKELRCSNTSSYHSSIAWPSEEEPPNSSIERKWTKMRKSLEKPSGHCSNNDDSDDGDNDTISSPLIPTQLDNYSDDNASVPMYCSDTDTDEERVVKELCSSCQSYTSFKII